MCKCWPDSGTHVHPQCITWRLHENSPVPSITIKITDKGKHILLVINSFFHEKLIGVRIIVNYYFSGQGNDWKNSTRRRRLPTLVKFTHKLAVFEPFSQTRLSRVPYGKAKMSGFHWLVLYIPLPQNCW